MNPRARKRTGRQRLLHRMAIGVGLAPAAALGVAALGALASRRLSRVHPLRVARAAKKLYPELARREGLSIVRKGAGLSPTMERTFSLKSGLVTRRQVKIRRGRMHMGAGPVFAHELGHGTGTHYKPLGRLREEWRANKAGARIWKKAGGSRLHYWGIQAPAMATYLNNHATIASVGLEAASRRRQRPKRRRR